MTEQEAIEIAKSEAKLKGWEYNPDSIIAFKLKRKFFIGKINGK